MNYLESTNLPNWLKEEEEKFYEIRKHILSLVDSSYEKRKKSVWKVSGLTSQIVSTKRNEDKRLLASDAAVAYGLQKNRAAFHHSLESMVNYPYFASIEIEEKRNNSKRKVQYLIGNFSYSDKKIVNWRTSPLARLYYEYEEGDEFWERIHEKERTGTVIKKIKYLVENGHLKGLLCSSGNFVLRDGSWKKAAHGDIIFHRPNTWNALPDISSLLTKEQFAAITNNPERGVMIQGVAGSGKSTAALYRLSWLLAQKNDLNPANCAVLVKSSLLRDYLEKTAKSYGIEKITVSTFNEWCSRELSKNTDGYKLRKNNAINFPRLSSKISLLSESFAQHLVTAAQQYSYSKFHSNEVFKLFGNLLHKLSSSESSFKFLTNAFNTCLEKKAIEPIFHSALLLLIRLIKKGHDYHWQHITVDEVQDMYPVEIGTFALAVKDTKNLTFVGDLEQQLHNSSINWEKINELWNIGNSADFLSFRINHRSTLPILRLASYVSKRPQQKIGKKGKPPIWYLCANESDAFVELSKWIERVIKAFPGAPIAIVTRSQQCAEDVASLLKPKYSDAVRILDSKLPAKDDGLIVAPVAKIQGLEYPFVAIWNVGEKIWGKDAMGKTRLYISITRACERLIMISWSKPSPWLPHMYSPILRTRIKGVSQNGLFPTDPLRIKD